MLIVKSSSLTIHDTFNTLRLQTLEKTVNVENGRFHIIELVVFQKFKSLWQIECTSLFVFFSRMKQKTEMHVKN